MIAIIDGPSGAGKSSLADRTVSAWRSQGHRVRLVRMDDLYRGWFGLREASERVVTDVVIPFAEGRVGRWRTWNWTTNRPGDWEELQPGGVLVLEGCGALSRASAAHADLRVWLAADDVERKRRALDRDGILYAPWWDTWQHQFSAFVSSEHPETLADLVLDGTAPGADSGVLDFPGYGGGMSTPGSETHYRVEYLDGPLAGQSEDRLLVNGEYDREFTTIAAVEGLESSFVYKAVDSRDLNGELHVRYSFDAPDSDPVQGDEDEGESLTI